MESLALSNNRDIYTGIFQFDPEILEFRPKSANSRVEPGNQAGIFGNIALNHWR